MARNNQIGYARAVSLRPNSSACGWIGFVKLRKRQRPPGAVAQDRPQALELARTARPEGYRPSSNYKPLGEIFATLRLRRGCGARFHKPCNATEEEHRLERACGFAVEQPLYDIRFFQCAGDLNGYCHWGGITKHVASPPDCLNVVLAPGYLTQLLP